MCAPWASTTGIIAPPLALGVIEEAEQKQGPPCGLAIAAERAHRRGHGALEVVPVERAGAVARVDPGPLHLAGLGLLLVIELVAQAAVGLVEDIIPDRKLAIGAGDLPGSRLRRRPLQAGISDVADTALRPLEIVADRLDAGLHGGGIAGIRFCRLGAACSNNRHQRHRDDDCRPCECGHAAVSRYAAAVGQLSHCGACGGLTTRPSARLRPPSSAISASLSLKSKMARLAARWSGLAVRGIGMMPCCTR